MFQQLVPLLRQRSVLLTVSSLEDDQIRRQCHAQEAEGRGEQRPHYADELHWDCR
jgi:hypothetical protein